MVAFTGWSWDYVAETLDYPRLAQLAHQWRRIPPLPVLVAAFLGAGMFHKDAPAELHREQLPAPVPTPGAPGAAAQNDDDAIRQLMQMLGTAPPPPKAP